ncbi:muconate cycloisomerase 1 [Burkholderia mallei]|nr:hypothetical protein X976_5662 [Burkholderia pseudomallei MSHR7500]KOS76528.1 muconate cycloisomerase 1 [Burkholderia mallei]KOS95675.1 muconate cycloisomerase 1 [Burkholderia mallei]
MFVLMLSGLSSPYARPPIVVPSPTPSIPSEHRTRTSTSVWQFIVATESLCGRTVGTSTSSVSIRSIVMPVAIIGTLLSHTW